MNTNTRERELAQRLEDVAKKSSSSSSGGGEVLEDSGDGGVCCLLFGGELGNLQQTRRTAKPGFFCGSSRPRHHLSYQPPQPPQPPPTHTHTSTYPQGKNQSSVLPARCVLPVEPFPPSSEPSDSRLPRFAPSVLWPLPSLRPPSSCETTRRNASRPFCSTLTSVTGVWVSRWPLAVARPSSSPS